MGAHDAGSEDAGVLAGAVGISIEGDGVMPCVGLVRVSGGVGCGEFWSQAALHSTISTSNKAALTIVFHLIINIYSIFHYC